MPARAHDLRQLAGVAERVRAPELAMQRRPSSRSKKRWPCRNWRTSDSPDGRLQSGSTQLPPTGTNWPRSTVGADARPQLGVALLDPRVLLRLRAREAVLGVLVHVAQLRAEAAQRLAVRLGERPQPGGVDVRVPDRGELVRVRGVAMLVERRRGSRRRPRCRSGSAPRAAVPPSLVARLGLERAQRLEVEVAAARPRDRRGRSRSGAARRAHPSLRRARCTRARSAARAGRAPRPGRAGRRAARRHRPCSAPGRSRRRARARPRCARRRGARRDRRATPRARSPRRGTSTSPTAARSARRAPRAGSRAPAPPATRCGRPARSRARCRQGARRGGCDRAAAPTRARAGRADSRRDGSRRARHDARDAPVEKQREQRGR